MSEECTHDCSTCGAGCDHVDAKDLIAPLNKDSAIKHVYAIMSGKGGVGKSSTTASLAAAMAKRGHKVAVPTSPAPPSPPPSASPSGPWGTGRASSPKSPPGALK